MQIYINMCDLDAYQLGDVKELACSLPEPSLLEHRRDFDRNVHV